VFASPRWALKTLSVGASWEAVGQQAHVPLERVEGGGALRAAAAARRSDRESSSHAGASLALFVRSTAAGDSEAAAPIGVVGYWQYVLLLRDMFAYRGKSLLMAQHGPSCSPEHIRRMFKFKFYGRLRIGANDPVTSFRSEMAKAETRDPDCCAYCVALRCGWWGGGHTAREPRITQVTSHQPLSYGVLVGAVVSIDRLC
jgi:hypothetical protein